MIRIPLDRWYGGTLEADGRVGRLNESEFNSWHRDSLKRLIGLIAAETVTLVASEAQDYLAERDERRSCPDAPEPCRVVVGDDGCLQVTFERPQRAVTPGQSLVLYDGPVCLGGAVIEATDAPLDRGRERSAGTIGAFESAPRSAAAG